MAIEQLGESLLASARKKRKKQERRAKIFTGLTLGLQVGNHFLRKKAQKRADEFWTSNQGLIDRRAGQFTKGIEFWDKHNTMVNTYGESKDSVTGENWVDALKQQKLKQYQADPRYSKLYNSALAEDQLEFNRSVEKLIQDDIDAYRQKVSGYSDFRTIGKDTKETRAAYLKPLKDKLQKGVDIINKQDNVGGWLLGGMGLKSSNDQLGDVNVTLPEGYTEQDKAELKTLVNNTFINMNKVNSAYGIKEPIPDVQLESMIKTKVFQPKVDLTEELKQVAESVLTGEGTFKKSDFKIEIGKKETTVANFLEEFEDDNGKHLTDSQKQNIINDALIIADYQFKIFKNNQEKSGAGPLMIPDGGIKSFFDTALKQVIGSDLTYKVGKGGFLLMSEEPRGTYKRTARENFVKSILNPSKDNIEVPAPNKKDGTITVDIDEAQSSIDVPEDTSKNPLDTPETPTFDRNRVVAVLNAPEWKDGSRTNEEKAAFWNGLIAQFPESADEIGQLAEESVKGPTGKRIVGITEDGTAYLTNYGKGSILIDDAPIDLVKKWTEEGKPGTPSSTSSPAPAPTPAPKDSLLSPNIPTQAELVKDFEILGADKMSSEEIDARLNEMVNQKDDFTTDEYIKLITYLNSKKGISPSSQTVVNKKPSILDMDSEEDIMNTEAARKAYSEAPQALLSILGASDEQVRLRVLKKANDYLEGNATYNSAAGSEFRKWLRVNNIKVNNKTSEKRKQELVQQFVETLA